MPVAVIFGSSYVERLRRYCGGNLGVPFPVVFSGKGGLRTDGIHPRFLQRALGLQADVVFLNVGGNDITAESRPRDIFNRIVDLVEAFKSRGATHIFIAKILPRGSFKPAGLTKAIFERQRNKLNRLLHKKYQENFVQFRDVKFPKDFHPDLVHLNPASGNSGMKKYAARIKKCLCSCQ